MEQTQTQARKLATRYAATIADMNMETIGAIHRQSKKLTYGVMSVSYAHQTAFLYKLFAPAFTGNVFDRIEAGSLIFGAIVIPGLFDLAIIMMIRILATPGMNPVAKKWARRYLPAPIFMSATVNVLASHTYVIAAVFVMVVSLIAVIEHLHSLVEPHFPTIDKIERRAITEMEPVTVETLDADALFEQAKSLANYDKMSAGEKQSFTIRYRKQMAAKAPVSPAVSPGK